MKLVMTVAVVFILNSLAPIAAAQTTIPLTLFMGKIPAFHASVNGHEGFFLFDTGGGISVLSPDFARFSGCAPWGQITGFRMTGQRLDMQRCDSVGLNVASAHLKTPSAGVFDIMTMAPKTAPHLDGSLGLDIFAGQVVTLDTHAHPEGKGSSRAVGPRRGGRCFECCRGNSNGQGLGMDGIGFWQRRLI
jgi:hypothetical protein